MSDVAALVLTVGGRPDSRDGLLVVALIIDLLLEMDEATALVSGQGWILLLLLRLEQLPDLVLSPRHLKHAPGRASLGFLLPRVDLDCVCAGLFLDIVSLKDRVHHVLPTHVDTEQFVAVKAGRGGVLVRPPVLGHAERLILLD